MIKKIMLFLAPLLLLIPQGRAFAECSWVLWLNSETFNADHSHDNTWEIQDAFRDMGQCGARKEQLSREFARSIIGGYDKSPSPGVERIDDLGSEVIVSYRNNVKGFFRYFCLPDTVNPRGNGDKKQARHDD